MVLKSVYVALIVYAMAAVIGFMVAGLVQIMSIYIKRQEKASTNAEETMEGRL